MGKTLTPKWTRQGRSLEEESQSATGRLEIGSSGPKSGGKVNSGYRCAHNQMHRGSPSSHRDRLCTYGNDHARLTLSRPVWTAPFQVFVFGFSAVRLSVRVPPLNGSSSHGAQTSGLHRCMLSPPLPRLVIPLPFLPYFPLRFIFQRAPPGLD